jgi:hypothetical protein
MILKQCQNGAEDQLLELKQNLNEEFLKGKNSEEEIFALKNELENLKKKFGKTVALLSVKNVYTTRTGKKK